MTEDVCRGWSIQPIAPPPWLPWAVAVLALFVTALAVWVSLG